MSQQPTDLAPLRPSLLEGALLLPAPELGTITVTGKDRQTWLNGIATCDLAPLKSGQGAFGLAVGKTGKILSPLYILIDDDKILIGAPRDRIAGLIAHFEHYVIMEDIELEDASNAVTWAFAHGPIGKDLPTLARAHGALAAAAVDTTGKGGALFAFEPQSAEATLQKLAKPSKQPPITIGDAEAWEALRIEIGSPRWGKDFTEENYPQEASIEELAVSFNKGCYLGQEAVFMLHARGHVKKKLVPLKVEGETAVEAGAQITLLDGTTIGSITSSTACPDTPNVLALGFVKYKHATAGTRVSVAGRAAHVR